MGKRTRRVAAEVVGGAIAGAVATRAMGKVTTLLYEREAASVRLTEDTAFWLLADEGAVYVLGLTPGPQHFPWQTHARGLAGHLVYGAVADATLAGLAAVPIGSGY